MTTGDVYVPPQRLGIRGLSAEEAEQVGELVSAAIEVFELAGYSLTSVTKHSNVTARLVSGSSPALALRMRTGPAVDGRTEFEWLSAVRGGSGVRVVEPFAATFDDNTRLVRGGDGAQVECSLFRWAQGQPLAAALSEVNYFELGRMTARLHTFAAGWHAPGGLQPLVWDRTMYYAGTQFVVAAPQYGDYVTRDESKTVLAVVEQADSELGRLANASDRRFLHGNVEMWNVLVTAPGHLRLLDFEDVMFGSPVLDIAITLFYGRERHDYRRLSEAYEAGYRSVREWPVRDARQMDLLVASRAAMLLNHGLLTESDKASVTNRLLPLILAAE